MRVKNLPLKRLSSRNVSVASPEGTVVRHHDHLIHMIVEGLGHLVECPDILVESWDCKYVGPVAEVRHEIYISTIITNGRGKPEWVSAAFGGPFVPDKPLTWPKLLDPCDRIVSHRVV